VSALEIVHPVPVDEIVPWFTSMVTTFLEDPVDIAAHSVSRIPSWDPARAWGARADGRWVATLRTVPHRLTIPGTTEELAADALTNVTVSATHRRRGLLRTMLTESLAEAAQRGDSVSILVAAEWPIYGRYGYAAAVNGAHYTVSTRQPGAILGTGPTGTVRQVEPDELGKFAPDIFIAARKLRAGNIDRTQEWWNRTLGLNGVARTNKKAVVHIVHEGDRGVDGYLSWSSTGEWDLAGELGQVTVSEFTAADDQAYLSLWHYLLGIDVVDRVHLRDRPVDEPLQWLLGDGRAIRLTHRGDRVWLRLLDVETALSARRYAVSDELVIDVVDDDGAGYAAGTYALHGTPDGAQCTRTTRTADLRLTQRALASSYLGGFSLAQQFVAGQVEELGANAVRRMDAMLSTPLAPWCATGF
jgi:predicted acetyltransferase